MIPDILNLSVAVWAVTLVALVGTGILFRRAWKRAVLEERLDRLRGGRR